MPQDATPTPSTSRPLSRASLDFATDRASAFAKARRHTILVGVLRLTLPVSGVIMVLGYALYMQRAISFSWANKKVEVTGISISQEALVAHNPRYTGFDKQGGEFEVRAATAQQDINMKGLVRLKSIDGKLLDASRQVTTLKSPRGTLDNNTSILELYERIDVASQNGMTADLTQATVYTKENRIVSNEPVTVRMPSGTVHGKAMTIEQKLKQVLFTGGVAAQLQAPPKPAADAGANPALRGTQQQGAASAAVKSNAPVDITSQRLLVDDLRKVATFYGNVVARQIDQVMETAELQVTYEGQTPGQAQGEAQGKAAGQSSLAGADGANKLRRLVSPRDVVLTRGAERATGSAMDYDAVADRAVLSGPVVISGGPDRGATADKAEIDNKTDVVLLTGNVVVTQQKNVLKGRRLWADRKQGTLNLTSPAGAGQAKAQISARLYQSEGDGAATKKAAPAPAVKAPAATGIGALGRSDPSQPIDIDADSLDVDDKKKIAIFRGKVKALQGDYTINTEEMVAHYTGDGGMALAAPTANAAPPASGQAKQGAQLSQVVMPRRVDILAKDGQRAQGNSAVFNPKTNTAKLTGDVVLSQGTSVTNGNCAELDMTTGLMKIIDACGFTSSGSPSSPGNVIIKGRAQAVFLPGMLKDEQKKSKDAAAGAQPAAGPAVSAPTAAAATPSPAPATPPRPTPKASGNELQSVFGNNN